MKILKLIIILLVTVQLNAQDILQCKNGNQFWIIKKDEQTYKVDLCGEIKKTERKNILEVDNFVLQYLIKDKTKYNPEHKDLTELELLILFLQEEMKFFSDQMQSDLELEMTKAPLSNDKDAIVWWYAMPEKMKASVKHQLFANVIIGDKIFGFASPQFSDLEFDHVRDLLMDVISTLEVVDANDLEGLCGE